MREGRKKEKKWVKGNGREKSGRSHGCAMSLSMAKSEAPGDVSCVTRAALWLQEMTSSRANRVYFFVRVFFFFSHYPVFSPLPFAPPSSLLPPLPSPLDSIRLSHLTGIRRGERGETRGDDVSIFPFFIVLVTDMNNAAVYISDFFAGSHQDSGLKKGNARRELNASYSTLHDTLASTF